MKKLLANKKGVTLLEGLIALLLLAVVATGTFAVMLSTSRKSTGPDIREEMTLAVEKASYLLQTYLYAPASTLDETLQSNMENGLCRDPLNPDDNPLAVGIHPINCLLPPVCDVNNNSSFSYVVSLKLFPDQSRGHGRDYSVNLKGYTVRFDITCNGYSL